MNAKWRAFAEKYLSCWNATEAAAFAQYAHPRQAGSRLLSNVDIKSYINQRLAEKVMSADEVLTRLAEQARGEHGKYLLPNGVDMAALITDGKAHLVKGIKETKYGTDIEFYDAQAALVHIGKHLGLFKERIDITSGDERIGASADEYHRSVVALAEALRSIVGPAGAGSESSVEPAEPAAMDGAPEPGG